MSNEAALSNINDSLSRINGELKTINTLFLHFERRVTDIETNQKDLYEKTNYQQRTDWKLVTSVLVLFFSGLGWCFSTVTKDRAAALVPISQSVSTNGEKILDIRLQLLEERELRKRFELDLKRMEIDAARHDERQKVLEENNTRRLAEKL